MNRTFSSSAAFISVLILFSSAWRPLTADEPARKPISYAIAIHGGAGASPESRSAADRSAYTKALRGALAQGRDILAHGGTSLDAVERVIRLMEDDPLFNAGRGAVYNSDGAHQLDASIMDGRDKACGAVAAVSTVKNPISLARLVMTKTPHVLLAADGADRFAREMGVPSVDQQYFHTARRYEAWLKRRKKQPPDDDNKGGDHKGTVGCVALDRHGNLAAGTSTGGLTDKKYGRVGDSPIIGAGTYADNATCAVSCTGIGEHFIRHAVAYDVSAQMAYKGRTVKQAVQQIIHHKLQRGDGGIIAVASDGSIWIDFNTPGMAHGEADSNGRFEVSLGR